MKTFYLAFFMRSAIIDRYIATKQRKSSNINKNEILPNWRFLLLVASSFCLLSRPGLLKMIFL